MIELDLNLVWRHSHINSTLMDSKMLQKSPIRYHHLYRAHNKQIILAEPETRTKRKRHRWLDLRGAEQRNRFEILVKASWSDIHGSENDDLSFKSIYQELRITLTSLDLAGITLKFNLPTRQKTARRKQKEKQNRIPPMTEFKRTLIWTAFAGRSGSTTCKSPNCSISSPLHSNIASRSN